MNHVKAGAPDSAPIMLWITRILAAIALAIAGYLLVNGDSAGGAVAGAIAFGLALFHYIPLVTEVSGFGVTAKLQREVQQVSFTSRPSHLGP